MVHATRSFGEHTLVVLSPMHVAVAPLVRFTVKAATWLGTVASTSTPRISVVPTLVAVITSTNYNTRGMHEQTDQLLSDYVLAAVAPSTIGEPRPPGARSGE